MNSTALMMKAQISHQKVLWKIKNSKVS